MYRQSTGLPLALNLHSSTLGLLPCAQHRGTHTPTHSVTWEHVQQHTTIQNTHTYYRVTKNWNNQSRRQEVTERRMDIFCSSYYGWGDGRCRQVLAVRGVDVEWSLMARVGKLSLKLSPFYRISQQKWSWNLHTHGLVERKISVNCSI